MENEEILLTEDELLATISDAGLNKSFQSFIKKYSDKKVTEGIKTREKNLQAKNLTDSEKITNLENELKELKEANQKSSLNTSIKASLKEAGLSEGFLNYIKVDKEEDIGSSVKDLKDKILDLKQESIDEKLKGNAPPVIGNTPPGASLPTEVKAYAEKISDIKK